MDAERALELNPQFSKAYYRRGTGYFCLGKLKAAQRGMQSATSRDRGVMHILAFSVACVLLYI